MSMARCCDCGISFHRHADETWKTRCVACFVKRKNRQDSNQWLMRAECAERNLKISEEQIEELEQEIDKLQSEVFSLRRNPSGLDRELKEHLRALLQYCHPDKHNGSQGATQVTQWLNDVKRRLPCA